MNLTPIRNNMNELETSDLKVLFSYRTPVAFVNKETGIFYKTSKKWSRTTSRHISQWLAEFPYSRGNVHEVDQETIDKIVEVR